MSSCVHGPANGSGDCGNAGRTGPRTTKPVISNSCSTARVPTRSFRKPEFKIWPKKPRFPKIEVSAARARKNLSPGFDMSDLSEVPTTSRWSLQLGFWSSALFSAHPLFTKMSCADNLRCCATPAAQLHRSFSVVYTLVLRKTAALQNLAEHL